MDRRVFNITLNFIAAFGLVLAFCSEKSFARGSSGGDYAPVLDLGINFYTGTTGKSLTGSTGYFFNFRAEDSKGFFRPHAAMELSYSGGQASIGSDTPSSTMFGAGFLAGVHLFAFSTGRFQPFVGGNGVFAWNYLKMTSPPSGIEPNTEGLSFGYEASAGVDMRFGSSEGNALRIKSGYWAVTSKLAGMSGFQLSGFRITIGIVY